MEDFVPTNADFPAFRSEAKSAIALAEADASSRAGAPRANEYTILLDSRVRGNDRVPRPRARRDASQTGCGTAAPPAGVLGRTSRASAAGTRPYHSMYRPRQPP